MMAVPASVYAVPTQMKLPPLLLDEVYESEEHSVVVVASVMLLRVSLRSRLWW
jgi:hypothetical protein